MSNWVLDIVRGAIRPIVTVIFAAVIAQAVTQGTELPTQFWSLAIPCIAWWFTERTVRHIKDRKESKIPT